jgi:uncharacterized protein YjbJ (UPF0337 family)
MVGGGGEFLRDRHARVGRTPIITQEPDMGINKDQVDGRVKEAAGKIQEVAGRVTGSPTQEIKGTVKKTVGTVQAGFGDAKERVKGNGREDARQDAKDSRP